MMLYLLLFFILIVFVSAKVKEKNENNDLNLCFFMFYHDIELFSGIAWIDDGEVDECITIIVGGEVHRQEG